MIGYREASFDKPVENKRNFTAFIVFKNRNGNFEGHAEGFGLNIGKAIKQYLAYRDIAREFPSEKILYFLRFCTPSEAAERIRTALGSSSTVTIRAGK